MTFATFSHCRKMSYIPMPLAVANFDIVPQKVRRKKVIDAQALKALQ